MMLGLLGCGLGYCWGSMLGLLLIVGNCKQYVHGCRSIYAGGWKCYPYWLAWKQRSRQCSPKPNRNTSQNTHISNRWNKSNITNHKDNKNRIWMNRIYRILVRKISIWWWWMKMNNFDIYILYSMSIYIQCIDNVYASICQYQYVNMSVSICQYANMSICLYLCISACISACI